MIVQRSSRRFWSEHLGVRRPVDIKIRIKNCAAAMIIVTSRSLKDTRNRLAHEMPDPVAGCAEIIHVAEFPKLVALLRKIEVWWIVKVEMPTDPDMMENDIDEDSIIPGPVMAVSVMLEVALGSDKDSNRYIKSFREASTKPHK